MMNFPVLAAKGAGSDLIMIIAMVVVMGMFYIFIFGKQNKEQKSHDAMLTSLEVGDSVVTNSGFYGTIIGINDEMGFVTVEFGGNKNCRINMKKEYIQEVEKNK